MTFASKVFLATVLLSLIIIWYGATTTDPAAITRVYDYDCSDGAYVKEANCDG